MTTIAWDGRTLAADRLCSAAGFTARLTKIRRTAAGWLIGACGNTSGCFAMLDWIERGEIGKPPMPLTSDAWSDILMVSPQGQVFFYGSYGRFPVDDAFCAIGSGMHYAIAAMALGRDAVGGVQLAAQFDPQTGAGINTLTLEAADAAPELADAG